MDNQFREPQASAQEIEQRLRQGIERAVESIVGDATQSPFEVFPNPAEKDRREDVEFGVEITGEQEETFRSAMSELGVGRENNRDAGAVGLPEGYLAFLEGGQSHKMLAELNVVADSDVKPSVIILSGDAERTIPEKEQALTSMVLGIQQDEVGDTEVEVAEQVLRAHPNFVAQDEEVLSYGCTIEGELTREATGQFRQIGLIGNVPAVVMRIDREWYQDDAGERKFKRPDNYTKMSIASQLENVSDVGFVTSATYQPSIEIDAIRATRDLGVAIKVPTYGTKELATVKGEEVPQPPALNQLAGEAYKVAQQLAKLEA